MNKRRKNKDEDSRKETIKKCGRDVERKKMKKAVNVRWEKRKRKRKTVEKERDWRNMWKGVERWGKKENGEKFKLWRKEGRKENTGKKWDERKEDTKLDGRSKKKDIEK